MESIKEKYEKYMKSEARREALENAPLELTMDSEGNPVLLSDEDSDESGSK